jgi:hypothetical protein
MPGSASAPAAAAVPASIVLLEMGMPESFLLSAAAERDRNDVYSPAGPAGKDLVRVVRRFRPDSRSRLLDQRKSADSGRLADLSTPNRACAGRSGQTGRADTQRSAGVRARSAIP